MEDVSSTSKRSFSLVTQKQKATPTEDSSSESSHPVAGPLPAVPFQNQDIFMEDVSSISQSGKRSFPLAPKNQKPTPTKDVSLGSPRTAQAGAGLQPMTDIQSNLPPKQGGRAAFEAARKKVAAYKATQKALAASATATQAERPEPNSEPMTEVAATLPPKPHPGGIKALIAEKKRQNKEWKASQKATTATVAKRPAPASEDRPNKRLHGGHIIGLGQLPDAGIEPHPFNITRHNIRFQPCFARVTFPDSRGTITFGSAFSQSKGTVAKVKVLPGKWGDPSVTLKMAVNKSRFNEDLASEEDEISNLKIVWQPYIKNRESYQVQEFTCRPVSESEHLQHPSVEEQAKQAGKDSSILIYVKMVTNSSQITSPHEAEYWRLLTRKGGVAARNMAICADFMSKAERDTDVTVEFWFRSGFSTSTWVSLIGDSFKRCVDEQHHYQGQDRIAVPNHQRENHAREVRPDDSGEGVRTPTETRPSLMQRPHPKAVSPFKAGVPFPGSKFQKPDLTVESEDKQDRARPEPTPFRPGDKVAKLVREGWSIMEAMDKVFGEVTGDSVESPSQSEAAAQDAASVQPSTSPHETLGLEPKGEVTRTAQKSPKMAIKPKTTAGEASFNPIPEQMEESDEQLEVRLLALVDQGWSYEAAGNEVYGKLQPAEEKPQKKESARQLNARVDALIDQGWSTDDAFEKVWGKLQQAEEKPQQLGQNIIDHENQGSNPPKAPAATDSPIADPTSGQSSLKKPTGGKNEPSQVEAHQ